MKNLERRRSLHEPFVCVCCIEVNEVLLSLWVFGCDVMAFYQTLLQNPTKPPPPLGNFQKSASHHSHIPKAVAVAVHGQSFQIYLHTPPTTPAVAEAIHVSIYILINF